jgi:hypothetical protein
VDTTIMRLAILVLWGAGVGCATQVSGSSQESERYQVRRAPLEHHGAPTVVPVPEGAPPESLRWAVEASLSERHWNVDSRVPGRIQASVRSNGSGEYAAIDITYGPGGIQIAPIAADVSPQRYDRWIRLLASNLNSHVAQIGMGRMATPWVAPPAPTVPPPPASEP